MTLICDTSTRWLSSLTTVELARVSLRSSHLGCILSSGINLETLSLRDCGFTADLRVQHTALKKLVIVEECRRIELSCPQLETFEYSGSSRLIFSLVSFLREASLNFLYKRSGAAELRDLSRNAPQIQSLSLWLPAEVPPPMPSSMAMSNLKRLDLNLKVQQGYDFFTTMQML